MKKVHILLLAGIFALSAAFTASGVCNDTEFFVEGMHSKMEHFDGKNKLTGTSEATVKSVRTSGDSVIAAVESVYLNDKGKEENRATVNMACVNGKLVMDMKGLIQNAAQANQKDMTFVIEGNFVEYSQTMTAGQSLPDVNMKMSSYSSGQLFSVTNIVLSNRKVEAKETKTTKAGTFETFKISYTISGTITMAGMNMTMNIPGMKDRKSVEWFSFKAGAVRVESYKGDKLDSYSELAELKKP